MNLNTIEVAEAEAKRFLSKVKAAKDAYQYRRFADDTGGFYTNEDTKATAALRRASMDLTRALAEMRRREP